MSRAASEQLTALEHLHELWLRLMVPVAMLVVGGGVAYVFRQPIIVFLKRPLHEQLYYTSPMGSFQFVMQVCLVVGVILALPILIYNILRFIEPVFSKGFGRRFVLLIMGASLALAAAGVAFSYYLTLPMALKFFGSVGTGIRPLITANEYLSFMLGYLVTFAIVFQLPLLLLFINRITPFKPGGLTKWRKYVYVGAFAISLIMPSSPDPLSQISLAIPIIALYELSVLLIWRVNRGHRAMLHETQKLHALVPELGDRFHELFEELGDQLSIAHEQAVPVPVEADGGVELRNIRLSDAAGQNDGFPAISPAPSISAQDVTVRRPGLDYRRSTRGESYDPDAGTTGTQIISDIL